MNSPELDRKTARSLELMIERDRDAFRFPAGAAPAISHLIERDEELEQFTPPSPRDAAPRTRLPQRALLQRARPGLDGR